jgi:hypothetical protein
VPSSNEVIRARNYLSSMYTWGRTPEPEAEAGARRDLTMAKARKAIREALLADPPLTGHQRSELAALLTDPSTYPVHVTIDGVSGLVCRDCGIPLRCKGEEADK